MHDPSVDPRRKFRDRLARLPRGAALVVGAALTAVGLFLLVRPLSSINVIVVVIGLTLILNGVGELLQARGAWPCMLAAAALVAAGVLVFLFRGFSTSVLALILGAAPVFIGVLHMVAAVRPGVDERARHVILATAAIPAGLIALTWPDLTLLIAAIAFGGWTVAFGVQLAWSAIASFRGKSAVGRSGASSGHGTRVTRPARLLGALSLLTVVAGLGAASVHLHRGAPDLDDFYTAPLMIPPEPGVLLQAESFARAMPSNSQAWRILYTTTRSDGRPALASALVIAPRHPPAQPLPLITWAHGTTGYAQVCAPTLLPDPLVAGALFTADQVIAHGWVLVATDYTGLGTTGPHPYLIGPGEARSTLDSIRAVRELKPLSLSNSTVIWGHSQGGHAALWAGGLAATYAPELEIDGVAALAPASDLPALVANLENVRGGILFAAYALAGYEAAYRDIRATHYVDPSAQTLVRQFSGRCLADPRIYVSIAEALAIFHDRNVFAPPLTTGPMLTHLRENVPTLPIRAPLLIAQGLSDPLVVPPVQREYVRARCNAGQKLEYLTVPGKDHVALVEADSPLIPRLFQWTEDRLAGAPAKDGCASLPSG